LSFSQSSYSAPRIDFGKRGCIQRLWVPTRLFGEVHLRWILEKTEALQTRKTLGRALLCIQSVCSKADIGLPVNSCFEKFSIST
jgi:hypothetical protein